MPGVTFFHAASPGDYASTLDALVVDERYACRCLFAHRECQLFAVSYPEYPIQHLRLPGFQVFLEGHLYGKTEAVLHREIEGIAPLVFNPSPRSRDQLANWLLRTDGDFLLFFWNESMKRFAFLNDALGRLPVYIWNQPTTFVLSRDVRLFMHLPAPPALDPLGIAQKLLFGLSLAKRTLWHDVRRLPAATRVVQHPDKERVTSEILHRFNFDEWKADAQPLAKQAYILADQFREATRNRVAPSGQTLVSLSGGLDSRAVTLALRHDAIPFVATTFVYHDHANADDALHAQRVNDRYGFAYETFNLSPPTGRDANALYLRKGPVQTLQISFLIDYLEKLRGRFGAQAWVQTGDGGGAILPLKLPPVPIRSTDALHRYLLGSTALPMDDVAALTGVMESEITESLQATLSTFLEKHAKGKFTQYLFSEYLSRFSYEGEDRNRCYLWHASPFYDIRFFREAMRCPDKQKRHYQLYAAFLRALAPDALEVGYSNIFGLKLKPVRYRLYETSRTLLRSLPFLDHLIRQRVGKSIPCGLPVDVRNHLYQVYNRNPQMQDILSPTAFKHLLAHADTLPRAGLYNLLTVVTTLVEHLHEPISLDSIPFVGGP